MGNGEFPQIENGQVWQAPWPYCHRAFILWVGLRGQADSYMLVSTPSIMGPKPAMPMGDPDAPGKLIQTQAEVEARLKKYGWMLLDRHYLTVVDRDDPWFANPT
jgi:hypothetical protein